MQSGQGRFAPPTVYRGNPLATPLILGSLMFAVWAVFGTPYLRIAYKYRLAGQEKVYLSALYWSFAGSFEAFPADLGSDTCPLLIFVKPDESLLHRLGGAARDFETFIPSGDAD